MSTESPSPSEHRLARIWWRSLKDRRDEMLCPACGHTEPAGYRDGEAICDCGHSEGEGAWR
jgi:CDGSH-type Zn-finger protein